MSDYPVLTPDAAPEGSKETMEAVQAAFGFLPNLHGVMAHSPTLLKSYATVTQIFGESSFDAVEQHLILLSVSFENECTYCMAAHSTVAGMVGMDEADLSAVRAGTELPDAKLNALARLTREIVSSRGYPSEETLQAFLDAGYERGQVLDVVAGVGLKTMSNYTNHLAHTPVDDQFAAREWAGAGAAA